MINYTNLYVHNSTNQLKDKNQPFTKHQIVPHFEVEPFFLPLTTCHFLNLWSLTNSFASFKSYANHISFEHKLWSLFCTKSLKVIFSLIWCFKVFKMITLSILLIFITGIAGECCQSRVIKKFWLFWWFILCINNCLYSWNGNSKVFGW